MNRTPIVAGNWKMNRTASEAFALTRAIRAEIDAAQTAVDVVLCPPFTALKTVADALVGSNLRLGAQNMHWEASGAFTGEVSSAMLRDLCCTHVILGHSERRTFFGETDDQIRRKILTALTNELTPIVCVGETLEQRKAGETDSVVHAQIHGCFRDIDADRVSRVVVAYEPVWAIGTGLTATPAQAQAVHARIRETLSALTNDATAQSVRIQYGGSMKPDNADELLAQPDIDGGLIGGASLEAASFAAIVHAAAKG